MFACFITHSLDVGLSGTNIQKRVVKRLGELLRLDQESPVPAAHIAASIATAKHPARA